MSETLQLHPVTETMPPASAAARSPLLASVSVGFIVVGRDWRLCGGIISVVLSALMADGGAESDMWPGELAAALMMGIWL